MKHVSPPQSFMRSFVSRMFPPPVFLAMPAAGVDMSDSSVKFMRLKRTRHGITPHDFGEYEIPKGSIEEGEIKDVEAVSRVLSDLAREHRLSFARVSLPEEKAYVFQTHIESTGNEESVRQAIEFKFEEHVPLSPAEAAFDYEILSDPESRTGEFGVSVVAYPRKTVERYTEAFIRARLLPISLETEAQAMARAVIKRGDLDTYMIVDFGKTRTGVSIISEGVLAFTSTIALRGQDLTDVIMKHYGVSAEEAARIKNNEGIMRSKGKEALREALMDTVSMLKSEIKRHYDYWTQRKTSIGEREEPLRAVILCGGNANLAGLPEYLSTSIGIQVERGNVWRNTFSFEDVIPPIERTTSLGFATAIGLVL